MNICINLGATMRDDESKYVIGEAGDTEKSERKMTTATQIIRRVALSRLLVLLLFLLLLLLLHPQDTP